MRHDSNTGMQTAFQRLWKGGWGCCSTSTFVFKISVLQMLMLGMQNIPERVTFEFLISLLIQIPPWFQTVCCTHPSVWVRSAVSWFMCSLRLICPCCQRVSGSGLHHTHPPPSYVATRLCLWASEDYCSSAIKPNGAYQHQYHSGKNICVAAARRSDKSILLAVSSGGVT